jgi:Zn-dependent protease
VPELFVKALLFLPMLLLAVSAHEAAHAWTALRLGDPTAEKQGRVSLLPFTHFDLIGSFVLPGLLLWQQASFLVGYAKPTPVDPGRFRDPKAGFAVVALAGPAGNLLLALLLALTGAGLMRGLGLQNSALEQLLAAGILINALLAAINLLPLPGFDGLKACYAFLPDSWCWRLQRAERWYILILVLAAWANVLGWASLPGLWLGRGLCRLAGLGLAPL